MHKVKGEVTRVKDIVGEKNEGSCADIDAQCAQYALHIELFSWWRHKQLDGDPGREATKIRPLVDHQLMMKRLLILPMKYLQGTYK